MTCCLKGVDRPVVVGVLGAVELVPSLVGALKENGCASIVVPDQTELQHEPSVRKWVAYASPDALILAQDKVKAQSASMVGSLLTGIHSFHCAMGIARAVLLTGTWPDPEFWMLVNLGQTMRAEKKLNFGWYLKHPKSPANTDWAKESVLALCELLQAQEANKDCAESKKQGTQVSDTLVPK